ncbi:hypothetical protein [Agrobacterium tumefaciens]|uniref:DinB/UmuC family translesion DNA polymerase n=1 Tax=Agrobacterium tumefaciens TaxID=358 RepID=UPI003013CB7B
MSFLDVTGIGPADLIVFGRDLRSTVRQWTGIPTCVGIGPTKTLAKLANQIAKAEADLGDVCDLTSAGERDRWLGQIEVAKVWGVGGAPQRKLSALGIVTAADLARLDMRLARNLLSVVGQRTVIELQGVSCLPLEDIPPQRKGCAVTRSSGAPVTDLAGMLEAVAAYATRVGEKLRRHGLEGTHMAVFMHTSRFNLRTRRIRRKRRCIFRRRRTTRSI